jgi:hypothetical protein
MMKFPMSAAAAGLLRALLVRANVSRDRILLIECLSTEWQSLTLIGERHQICFRVPDPDADDIVTALTSGLEDAEFSIPGQIVADIGLGGPLRRGGDRSIIVELEALTILE